MVHNRCAKCYKGSAEIFVGTVNKGKIKLYCFDCMKEEKTVKISVECWKQWKEIEEEKYKRLGKKIRFLIKG